MKKRLLISIAAATSICFSLFADIPGTVVQTTDLRGAVMKNTFTWQTGLSNSSCIAYGTVAIRGELLRVVFNPINPTYQITSPYTVTLKDANGIDVLAGLGTTLTTGTITSVRPGIATTVGTVSNIAPFALNDLLMITVTNGGSNVSGQVIIYTK